jgi:hypothetical protein
MLTFENECEILDIPESSGRKSPPEDGTTF